MTEDSKDGPAPDQRPLLRSHERRVLAGVCGGLGQYTRIDPVVFRVGFALLVLANGSGILLYIVAALLLPGNEFKPAPIEQVLKRRFDAEAMLAILTAVLGVALLWSLSDNSVDGPLTVATVFALGLLVAHSRGVDLLRLARTLPERLQGKPAEPYVSAPPYQAAASPAGSQRTQAATLRPEMIDLATLGDRPRTTFSAAPEPPFVPEPPVAPFIPVTPPRPPRRRSVLSPLTLLVAELVAALMGPVASAYPSKAQLPIVLGSGLAVIAVGLVAGSRYGRPRGLVAAGTILSLALVTTSAAAEVPSGGRFGDVSWRPVDAGTSEQTYRIIAGQGALDLTAMPLRPGQRIRVQAELGVGGMRVKVPRTARVVLRAQAGLGDVTVEGRITGGPRAKVNEILQPEVAGRGEPPVIELSFNGRIGDLEVTRA